MVEFREQSFGVIQAFQRSNQMYYPVKFEIHRHWLLYLDLEYLKAKLLDKEVFFEEILNIWNLQMI